MQTEQFLREPKAVSRKRRPGLARATIRKEVPNVKSDLSTEAEIAFC